MVQMKGGRTGAGADIRAAEQIKLLQSDWPTVRLASQTLTSTRFMDDFGGDEG